MADPMIPLLALDDLAPQLAEDVFVAPGAVVVGDVQAGPGTSFWYHAVARGDVVPIRLGARVNVQDGAILHGSSGRSACVVGDEVTIGHRAIVHGCRIGDRSLIGMGAIVLDDAVIEEECMVGAGALVTSGTVIPAGHLAIGSPARVVRPLRPEERNALRASALHYAENAARHARATKVE